MQEPTMTIHYKDGRDSFTVPYSETAMYRYQKVLGDQIKDIEFNNMEAPSFAATEKNKDKDRAPVVYDLKAPDLLAEIKKQNETIISQLKELNEKLSTQKKSM